MAASRLYEILNVAPTAEPEVIEAAYRVLMKKYHPDRRAIDMASGRNAADINAAYAVLRDAWQRSEYDRQLQAEAAARFVSRPAPMVMAAPPRRANLAAWSGWLLALGLGCYAFSEPLQTAILGSGPSPFATRLPPVDFASSRPAAENSSEIEFTLPLAAVAESPPVLVEPEPAVAPEPAAEAVAQAAEDVPVAAAPRMAASAAVRRRPPAPPRRRPAEPRQQEADFLEREGYIY